MFPCDLMMSFQTNNDEEECRCSIMVALLLNEVMCDLHVLGSSLKQQSNIGRCKSQKALANKVGLVDQPHS